MSLLIVKVCQIDKVLPHSNADKLEIAHVGGWQCVVGKGQYNTGDKIVYVPPDSVIPKQWSDIWGVTNYLSSNGRVKSIRLRGEYSFGLVVTPENKNWPIGHDVAEFYGITKYEPPVNNSGGSNNKTNARPMHPLWRKYTEIENIRHYANAISNDEEVVVSEKIHGCNVSISMLDGELVVGSRNMNRMPPSKTTRVKLTWKERLWPKNWLTSHKLVSTVDEDAKKDNWFWYPTTLPNVVKLVTNLSKSHKQVILYGETFGNVQNLNYGIPNELGFLAFDLFIDGKFVDYDEFAKVCFYAGVEIAPVLYRGPYDLDKIKPFCTGPSSINNASHIMEGGVVKPVIDRCDPRLGRIVFKCINPDYLVGKSDGKFSDSTEI